ncbi:hypothetical protein F511_30543 [Dorcoceras hygrometricum]|uniref:Uncharacterized protein n=1 Tax=Dorcoceras hygrometricum TaxID=472368 RepID=A0A2Z7APR1_9LAMI|nr:hypothetical protein F511_30543 [Dorcoceras hygrometricum]
MSSSHNKIPMFSKEEYYDWKIRMQDHLAAQDDDMWYIITDGPMKIMKANTAMAITADLFIQLLVLCFIALRRDLPVGHKVADVERFSVARSSHLYILVRTNIVLTSLFSDLFIQLLVLCFIALRRDLPVGHKAKEPWLPDRAELGSTRAPWYEEKSSNLRSSDISFIKEKGGMFDKFEVVLPGPEERAHRPPRGFHTFYINQLEMGLWFPLPRFIAALCQHIKISPSQLAQILQISSSIARAPPILQSSPRPIRPHAAYPDERMGKVEMLKALEEAEAASSGTAAPPKATRKRKASTPVEKEARRQRKKKVASTSKTQPAPTTEKIWVPTPPIPMPEEHPGPTPVITIPEASSPKEGPTKETSPDRVPTLNFFEDSLVVSPSGIVATNLLCHIAPDGHIGRLAGTSNSEAVGLFSSNLAAALDWGGEVIKRLTRAQQDAGDLHRSFEDTTEHCTELETRLVEVEAARAEEARASETHLAALETRGLRAELDETKARAEEEAERLRSEAINAWDLGKEAFLKSSEFGSLCAKKALGYFKVRFSGCLAQFRANGYSEEERPASFLDFKKALMDMADEEATEEEEEEEEEEDEADAIPPRSPRP